MDAPIKVAPNFITESDCKVLMDYIDLIEGTLGDKFVSWQEGRRVALQFGEDLYHSGTSYPTLEILGKDKQIVERHFERIIDRAKELFDVAGDLYMSSFWIAKQYPDAIVDSHEDTDGGFNTHFRYSGVLYLNKMSEGGKLFFDKYQYSYAPEGGDLVMFPSQGTGNHEVTEITQQRYSLVFWLTDIESMGIPK